MCSLMLACLRIYFSNYFLFVWIWLRALKEMLENPPTSSGALTALLCLHRPHSTVLCVICVDGIPLFHRRKPFSSHLSWSTSTSSTVITMSSNVYVLITRPNNNDCFCLTVVDNILRPFAFSRQSLIVTKAVNGIRNSPLPPNSS